MRGWRNAVNADRNAARLRDFRRDLGSGQDAAVYTFATKVARDASTVEQADVDDLRAAGLTDADVADVVFAVAARAFFTKVLDGLGARLDQETAATFHPDLLRAMVVGNPVGDD